MDTADSPPSVDARSDDEEGGYDTVTVGSDRRGVKLLFAKSKVYVHPTPSARDNVAGYIALLQQKTPSDRPSSPSSSSSVSPASSDLLLAWIPESALGDAAGLYVKADLSEAESPTSHPYLVPPPPTVTTMAGSVGGYAFAVPLSAIFSLLVRPPSVGWWHGSIVINARNGEGAFPPLFFHDGECQSTMLQKKRLARDAFDPFGEDGRAFWGADEVLRWLRRYVRLERSGPEPNVYLMEPSDEDVESFGQNSAAAAAASTATDTEDAFVKFVKDTGWSIMNQFSKVTTLTRRAAQDLADNSNVPPQVRRLLRNPEVQTLQNEFDSARIYLARWAMGIAEQSERDHRTRYWTARDVAELEDTDVGAFELVDVNSAKDTRRAVTTTEWKTWFDDAGKLSVTVDEVKERIFHGGLADDGRNFLRDQSGMRAQLLALDQLVALMDPPLWEHLGKTDSTNFFFMFRMVLVWYKREFVWGDVLTLWERLWTDWLSSEMHLFIALAILEKHRDVMMQHLKAFDEVLKYVNELANTMDLESTLLRAESLFRRFQRLVDAMDKRDNFPAPTSAAATAARDVQRRNTSVTPELRRLLGREPHVCVEES
ncbi:Rab-GAP/TBC domain protein [Ophiocordyceps camponoti-floridani]|uniref:GTPase-activating protein GYP7 n=1 Tax=Ophiocordyceps camponoti-floridani TaxID=2030778 RepID=A0A8H4Q5G9_9HYPO|nr:Rab-GAP/TBC domain protein [Ophiocordyceps camponoti-floridani]